MAKKAEGGFEREVRDTVLKSSLSGVAATALAVTIFSPAGFGGLVGTSLASGFGGNAGASSAENPYANLPAYPTPLSIEEVQDIRGKLAATAASMEITRAATDERIERVRSIAMANGLVSFSSSAVATPVSMPVTVPTIAPRFEPVDAVEVAAVEETPEPAELRLSLSEPVSVLAPVEVAPVEMTAAPVSYTPGGGADYAAPYEDTHLAFADLLFADEQF